MIKASFDNAQDDMQARELAEQRVEADRVIESVIVALQQDGADLLTEAEFHQIENALKQLMDVKKAQIVMLSFKESKPLMLRLKNLRQDE